MINLFWDPNQGDWEITTRNKIGANTGFHKVGLSSDLLLEKKSKSFREMFFEAVKETKFTDEWNKLNKSICYSFVLQHPENRIVVPVKSPQLYLVGMFGLNKHSITVYNIHFDLSESNVDWKNTKIKFPEIYKFHNYSELIHKYASINTPYYVMGVVIYNLETGERTKIRNPIYEEVKLLRGNQPKKQYQYICLRKQGKVGEYLKYFPENKEDCSFYRDQIHLFTNTLFDNYVACYIKKEKPLLEYPEQFRTHMFTIHQSYIQSIKNNLNDSSQKFYINKKYVIDYINNLHPSLLMYCLNYHLRKKEINEMKLETENILETADDFVIL
jgi:hypothetical protein